MMGQIDAERVRYWLGYRAVDLQVIQLAIARVEAITAATVVQILFNLERLNGDILSGRIDGKEENRAIELGYRLVANLSTATGLSIQSDVFGSEQGSRTVYKSSKRIRG